MRLGKEPGRLLPGPQLQRRLALRLSREARQLASRPRRLAQPGPELRLREERLLAVGGGLPQLQGERAILHRLLQLSPRLAQERGVVQPAPRPRLFVDGPLAPGRLRGMLAPPFLQRLLLLVALRVLLEQP